MKKLIIMLFFVLAISTTGCTRTEGDFDSDFSSDDSSSFESVAVTRDDHAAGITWLLPALAMGSILVMAGRQKLSRQHI